MENYNKLRILISIVAKHHIFATQKSRTKFFAEFISVNYVIR